MTTKKQFKHGGKRPGSGRPKGEETKIITFRVPKRHAAILRELINQLIKTFVRKVK